MAEAAVRLMSVEDFLVWDDSTDRRYELIDGDLVMMAPPRKWHRRILANLIGVLHPALPPPFKTEAHAGILLSHRERCYYVADLAVTAAPDQPNDPWTDDPIVIIEVLSPETGRHHRVRKRPDYAQGVSVREIVLIASERRRVEVWRRAADGAWPEAPIIETERLRLYSVGVDAPLDAVYANTGL